MTEANRARVPSGSHEWSSLNQALNDALHDHLCMAVVAASRKDNSAERNAATNTALRKTLKDYEFGHRQLIGHYPEEALAAGSNDNFVTRKDESSLVISSRESEELLLRLSLCLCRKYHQDAILCKPLPWRSMPLSGGGTLMKELGSFSPDILSEYLSELKNAGAQNGSSYVMDSVSAWHDGYALSYLSALLRRERIKRFLAGDEF